MIKTIKSFELSCGGFPLSLRYCYKIENEVLKLSATIDKDEEYIDIEKESKIDSNIYIKINDIIKDWKDQYRYEDSHPGYVILDGFCWNLDVTYDDGSKKHIEGHEEYPDNYDELIKYLNEALNVDIDLSFVS